MRSLIAPRAAVPDGFEFAFVRAFLARYGLTPAELTTILGASPAGRSREQIEQALTAWLAARPRKGMPL